MKLSINVNKIATIRNARGNNMPDLLTVTENIIQYGAMGITIHPRPDRRHIYYEDVVAIDKLIREKYPYIELNIEGFPNTHFLDLICMIKPTQCTLVPDPPYVITSNAGWKFQENKTFLKDIIKKLKKIPVRKSLFLDPHIFDEQEYQALIEIQPDRVELYTESYATAYSTSDKDQVISIYQYVANQIHQANIQINAGHDLNQENLAYLYKKIPLIQEVSIGHAFICESLYHGMQSTMNNYIKIIEDCK